MSNRKQGEAEVFRHTVRPGIRTPLFLKTVPEATCLLRRPEDTDPERGLKYFADDDGIICVHVRPSVEAEDVAKFVIECSADGRVTHHPLELRASQKDTPEMPFPARQRPAREKRGTIRPALSEEEALRLSQEELRERGYPPRPHLEAFAPFKTWLRSVSVPMTMVEPRLVTNTGVSHQPQQELSASWSGFEIRGGPFNQLWGRWVVPAITNGEPFTPDSSAFWIGIDGDPLLDGPSDGPIQVGTEQDIIEFFSAKFKQWFSFTNYYAWTQFKPQQRWEQQILNFSVNPGDEMFVSVSLDDSTSTANFQISNLSSNPPVMPNIPPLPFGSTVVAATEAEWIMERTSLDTNIFSDLADYYYASMTDAWARIPGGVANYQGIGISDTGGAPEFAMFAVDHAERKQCTVSGCPR